MSDLAQRSRAIADQALSLPEDDRLRFVLERTEKDADLTSDVLSRLGMLSRSVGDPTPSFEERLRRAFGKTDPRRVSLPDHADAPQLSPQRALSGHESRGAATSRYEIQGEIGAGGMGRIYSVYERDLRRTLAMKVILDSDDRKIDRFIEEAQVTGQLDHPGIVPIHEIGLDSDYRVYFTMKLVRGETLRDVIEKVHAGIEDWNQTRVLGLIQRICEAMAFAHSKGVVHRDLKPANIMVGRFGEVYVMDFGLARVLGAPDSKDIRIAPGLPDTVVTTDRREKALVQGDADSPLVTMDGDILGTPSYMPPEQAAGNLELIGPQSDVYSVGAILYHLLTGAPPYSDDPRATGYSIVKRVLAAPPAPLTTLARDASPELVAIVDKAMARRVDERYSSMIDQSSDLRAYLEHRVVAAYRTGAFAELRKWIERNPALASAAGILILVLAGWASTLTKKNRDIATKKAEVDAKNLELVTANTTIQNQKAVVESRKAEFDQLSGVVLLESASVTEKNLYPAWPDKIPAIERWIEEMATPLLDMKPTVSKTIADLESRALPWTDDDRSADYSEHPSRIDYEAKSRKLTWLRERLAGIADPTSIVIPELSSDLAGKSAMELCQFARDRLKWDFSSRIPHEERLALAAANAALAKAEAGDTTATTTMGLDAIGWANFAVGRDTEARNAIARAIELAHTIDKAMFRTSQSSLESAIVEHSGAAAEKLLAGLEEETSALETIVSRRSTWKFPDASQKFLHTTLQDLVTNLAAFEANTLPDVRRRADWARSIAQLTVDHPRARIRWSDAQAAIALADDVVASKLYATVPIRLVPQVGLVPIGMNPVTKLWEFYDLRSAFDVGLNSSASEIEIPTHRDDGSIDVVASTGIILVLIPGGRYQQGAQSAFPDGASFDANAQPDESIDGKPDSVGLDPFFISKYETTQGQWLRLAGSNPSYWMSQNSASTGLNYPIETVSWVDCYEVARRFGFALPTEAQWEYACRAGTTTVFSFGDVYPEMARFGNVRDRSVSVSKSYGNVDIATCDDWNDGHASPSPVGTFLPNRFGLYDMHGNVWEWCRDAYATYYDLPKAGDGLRGPADSEFRVARGASVQDRASLARSANRTRTTPGNRRDSTGVRFSRAMQLE